MREAGISNQKYLNQSIVKAAAVLDLFTLEQYELGISTIAAQLDMPVSTTHRILNTLESVGYISQNAENGKYRLGLKCFVLGNRVRVKVVKNKVAPPFREAEFDIMFGRGISREGDILDLAAKEGIVEKSGAWYAYNGSKIGQGRENAKVFLANNPSVMEEIERQVRVRYGFEKEAEAPSAQAAE